MSVPAIKLAFVWSNMQNTRAKKKKNHAREKFIAKYARERKKKPSGNMVAEKKNQQPANEEIEHKKNDYT